MIPLKYIFTNQKLLQIWKNVGMGHCLFKLVSLKRKPQVFGGWVSPVCS
jgi:hypothetical protein